MRKFITAIMKAPYLISTPNTVAASSVKSTRTKSPITGEIMSFTRDVTIAVNAAPTTIPMAISITFPCIANSLNSFIKFLISVSSQT